MASRRVSWWQRYRPGGGRDLIVALFLLWPIALAGEIFRYQDQYGGWHFTDDPPSGVESSIVPDIPTSKSASPETESEEDLAASLRSTYNPATPIAYATLAVVSVKAGSVEGSGFFCSDQGHVLTSRHVVRPEFAPSLDEQEQALENREGELRAVSAKLKEARAGLRPMSRDLEGYKELIDNARDDATRSWARSAHARLSKRYRSERARISSMERSLRLLKRDLRLSKRELGFERRSATKGNRFDIVLKDGTELTATLVSVDEDQDLALLKLDGYRTPVIPLDPLGPLPQGMRVFAIGNPLGMQDAVTSGVITQTTPEYLLTDAQILPGSSGGPLIRESGEVVGINVSRKVEAGTSRHAPGFGKVIPISVALKAFPKELAHSEIRVLDSGQVSEAHPGGGASSSSAPVRLILTDEAPGLDPKVPAEPEPRSLDFPPEGGGLPSGLLPPGQ